MGRAYRQPTGSRCPNDLRRIMAANTVKVSDSAMVAAVALGMMIDREFMNYCRELGLDGRIAMANPLDTVIMAESHIRRRLQ
jgi:hypothetical protein